MITNQPAEEYFQKKLADKLAEHARADAGFPQKESDMDETFGKNTAMDSYDDITSPLSPDERKSFMSTAFKEDKTRVKDKSGDDINVATKEEKHKHLKELLDPKPINLSDELFEQITRAVLKDLGNDRVIMDTDEKPNEFYTYCPEKKHRNGIVYQRIGSISEKVEIVREGYI
jgi:hypothetical protein